MRPGALAAALLVSGTASPAYAADGGATGPLVISSELVFAKDAVLEAGEIVFRPGGHIRVASGAKLVVRASSITAEEGAVIDIDGHGEAGETGKPGAPCPACQVPVQRVQSSMAFAAALNRCQDSGVGAQGENGGAGKPGAMVEILAENIQGKVRCDVSGGEPGKGGSGGPGLVLERQGQNGSVTRISCPKGPSGPTGAWGPDGRCVVRSRQ